MCRWQLLQWKAWSRTVKQSERAQTWQADGTGISAEAAGLVQSNVVFLVVSQLHSPESCLLSSFTRVVAGEVWRLCRAGTAGQQC